MDIIILGEIFFRSDYKIEVTFDVFAEWLPPTKAKFDR